MPYNMELRSLKLNTFLSLMTILASYAKTSKVIDASGKVFSRGSDADMAYVNFKADKFSYLNITNIGSDLVDSDRECGFACLEITSCFSYNLAVFRGINGKLLCELLPSDKYNNTDKFVASLSYHHFSIPSPCSSWPCQNNGTCVSQYDKNSFVCVCPKFYTGKHCETINTCISNPCKNGATCNSDGKVYKCACPSRFTGLHCETGTWKDLIGNWTDNGNSWTGSLPHSADQWHYGPARIWTTPVNTDKYVITSRVQILSGKGCGHVFKYKSGCVVSRTNVSKAWGYFLWGSNSMYITSSGPESSPRINFAMISGAWYDLKSQIRGTSVEIYVNNTLVKKITMSKSGAGAKSDNYVGLWCHNAIYTKGDSFQVEEK